MKMVLLFVFAMSFALPALHLAAAESGVQSIDKMKAENSKTICRKNLEPKEKEKRYSKMKLIDSALFVACNITARSAFDKCETKLVDDVKGYSPSQDKVRFRNLLGKTYDYCMSYADVVSNVVVEMVLEDAEKNKISVNDAAKKLIDGAAAEAR